MEVIVGYWPTAMAVAALSLFAAAYWDERTQRIALQSRFRNVVDADAETARVLKRATVKLDKLNADAVSVQETSEKLRAEYADKRQVYDRLLKEIAIFDEKIAFSEMGVYAPHFEFNDSEEFKSAIELVRSEQKGLVSAEKAVVCLGQWQVNGSKAKGKTMTARNVKLTLRAFNNECDAAIANARWNNVLAMEKRIGRAKEQIDKLNASNTIVVTDAYFELKIRELRLTHEHRQKLQQEREERAEAARLAREEQRLLKDLEQAERDEAHYARLLAKAKAEAASVAGPKLDAFADQIRVLERDLNEARAKAARAQAMAERTSSGYVYIISNVGSFGDSVVKIGLTRRLDPLDRVRELGDARVPFVFDVHAVIYSENAPALERALHNEFESTRINTQNLRKEFFKIAIDSVEAAVKRLAPSAPFFKDIEAQEYRETVAKRSAALGQADQAKRYEFPIAV